MLLFLIAHKCEVNSNDHCRSSMPSGADTKPQDIIDSGLESVIVQIAPGVAGRMGSVPAPIFNTDRYFSIFVIFEPSRDKSPIKPFSANTNPRMGFFRVWVS